MTKTTHIMLGLGSALVCNAFIPTAILGALAPDLDCTWAFKKDSRTGKSVNRRLPPYLRHRGFTHHLLLWSALLLVATFCIPHHLTHELMFGYAIGGLSHLAGDMVNPSGIPYWRTRDRLALKWLKTNSVMEGLFVAVVMAVAYYFTPANVMDLQMMKIGL